MNAKVLFACSKCFSRHPFEELSSGQQLCKECRGSIPTARCTYCRTEFQLSKGNTSNICKKCDQNIKQYGKPSACECCNIVAAFIGTKCQRCANSESKYGPPVQCDQCKQRSAFDRQDDSKKVNGKLLCYLCTCSYKRALAKAAQGDKESRNSKKRMHEKSAKDVNRKSSRTENSKPVREDAPEKNSLRQPSNGNGNGNGSGSGSGSGSGNGNGNGNSNFVAIIATTATKTDTHGSEHVVATTQLKEQIAGLQRRLNQKDRDLLEKDKQITELKSKNWEHGNETRTKLKEVERLSNIKIELLNNKISGLLKEIASLKRAGKKNGLSGNKVEKDKDSVSTKDSGGSGTDSPSTN